MTSQGSASGRFQRAIQRGNLFHAELAAKEMGGLQLGHALDLCRLLAAEQDPRFERAAVRWHGRFVVERDVGRLTESQLLLSTLAELPQNVEEVEVVLRRIARRPGGRLSRRESGPSTSGRLEHLPEPDNGWHAPSFAKVRGVALLAVCREVWSATPSHA